MFAFVGLMASWRPVNSLFTSINYPAAQYRSARMNAQAGPSTSHSRFVSAQNRPEQPDGIFRVVIISSGSVASVKIPEIVGALAKVSLRKGHRTEL